MHRRKALAALAFSSTAVLAGSRAFGQATPTIEMAGAPYESLTGIYYGIKDGLFQRQGLVVEMVPTMSGAAAMAAVIAGTYQIGETSLLAVFYAHIHNVDLVMVAPSTMYTAQHPSSLLQIAADSPYKSGADLNGKIIGGPSLNDLSVLATRAWVDKTGGDWRSLRFVEIPSSAAEEALVQHRVDAASMQTPQLDRSLAAGTTKTLADAFSVIAPTFLIAAYVARADWASAHADEVRRYNRALAEAVTYVDAHPAETAPLVAELTKVQLENARRMKRSLNGTSLDAGVVQPFINAAVKYEMLPYRFPASATFWSGASRSTTAGG